MPTNPSTPSHHHPDDARHLIWEKVSHSPLHNLWDFQGVPPSIIFKRTYASFMEDNLLSRAAELGYYFLFALFPTLISASAIFGLVARNTGLYVKLLNYFALVIPQSAFGLVLDTFNQTTRNASGGKITFGLAAALWSASVGFAAIQDTLNIVYKVKETRPYWKVRGAAILVTLLLSVVVILTLASLFGGDFLARYLHDHMVHHAMSALAGTLIRIAAWVLATGLLMLLFALIYYFAPDVQHKQWHWLTPGAFAGIACWLLSSIALRIYLHFSNSFTITYGSLGAVIILLTWFYITGLMLLLGAELNSEIAAAVLEKRLKETGQLPPHATANQNAPVQAA